jgi:hypothetical protein
VKVLLQKRLERFTRQRPVFQPLRAPLRRQRLWLKPRASSKADSAKNDWPPLHACRIGRWKGSRWPAVVCFIGTSSNRIALFMHRNLRLHNANSSRINEAPVTVSSFYCGTSES